MRTLLVGCTVTVLTAFMVAPALAWFHAGPAGMAAGGGGSWNARSYRGGSASGGDGSWQANGYRGGSASGGDGTWQATGANGNTAYGTNGRYYGANNAGYYQPTVVNTYAAGCSDCGDDAPVMDDSNNNDDGGGSDNDSNQDNNDDSGGSNDDSGDTTQSADNTPDTDSGSYTMGAVYTTLPGGCMYMATEGSSYYSCNGTWFKPAFGANGVHYRVVPAP